MRVRSEIGMGQSGSSAARRHSPLSGSVEQPPQDVWAAQWAVQVAATTSPLASSWAAGALASIKKKTRTKHVWWDVVNVKTDCLRCAHQVRETSEIKVPDAAPNSIFVSVQPSAIWHKQETQCRNATLQVHKKYYAAFISNFKCTGSTLRNVTQRHATSRPRRSMNHHNTSIFGTRVKGNITSRCITRVSHHTTSQGASHDATLRHAKKHHRPAPQVCCDKPPRTTPYQVTYFTSVIPPNLFASFCMNSRAAGVCNVANFQHACNKQIARVEHVHVWSTCGARIDTVSSRAASLL
jgi:hypothetical protein